MNSAARLLGASFVSAFVLAACTSGGRGSAADARVAALARTVADSVATELIAPGVQLHRLVHNAEPWRASLLEVDLGQCVDIRAVKGGEIAVGRTTTGKLLAGIEPALRAVAAVNADFFLFTPPGVPVGAMVSQGRMLSGPIDRPVFAMTANNRPWIGRLFVTAQLQTSRGGIAIASWNRPGANSTGIVDAAWGIPLDSTIARPVWTLTPLSPRGRTIRYVASPISPSRSYVVTGDTLLVVGMRATSSASSSLRVNDTVTITRTFSPITPREAVGGQPVLLRDSTIVGAVDSVNNAGFRALNPRTAIGYADHGRRLLIVVIDGRQPKYSVGMSLRDMAQLFRALGATDAINLDGGGSSAMALTDSRTQSGIRLATHPSDSVGERPVANALAILRSCK